jgi:hypothetical protein
VHSDIRKRYILHQLSSTTLGIALIMIAGTLGVLDASSGGAVAQRTSVSTLRGQVGIMKSDGTVVPAEPARVYVLFSLAMEGGSSSHVGNVDTAGGQFSYHLNSLLAKNRELKNLEKSARLNARLETANQIAACYLQSVDEALSQVRNWLAKRPDRSWQMKTFVPDGQGF